MKYKKLLFKTLLIIGLFFVPELCRAMPPGTLLYRTSGDGKMFGYSGDPLIYSEKGIMKNIYSGHVAIYIGKENGQDYIVEAMSGGIVKNPAKYFVNRADGETFLGARLPAAVNALQQARVVALAKNLVGKRLGYDFDFHTQKGPGDKEWTCVGLTEKLYESADILNPANLGDLEYDPAGYAINITPDGFDAESVVNDLGDCFSRSREFSKIARRTNILIPAPEIIGYDVGLEYRGNRYIFLPYTQFLQPALEAVAADVEISSAFSRAEVNGPMNTAALAARWSLINNPLSSLKIIGQTIKEAVVEVAAKTKEIAQNLASNIFGGGTETSLTLINDSSLSTTAASGSKKTVAVKKKTTATVKTKTAKTTKSTSAAKSTPNNLGIKVSTSKTTDVEISAGKAGSLKVSTGQTTEVKAAATKASTTKISASKATKTNISVKAAVNHVTAATSTYYNLVAESNNSTTVSSSSSSSSSGSSSSSSSGSSSAGSSAASHPQLASINRIYSTGDNDWVEIINTTDYDFDLAAAGYRLEKAKTAEDPSLLIRLGDADDGTYPGGTVIKAHDTYLIVSSGANSYYRQKADALVSREGFSWPGSGYTLYLGTGAISSSTDADIVDAVGFGEDATYFLGTGPAPEIIDNYILRRASSSSNNAFDFTLVLSDDPSVEIATSTPDTATSTSETATTTPETVADTATSTVAADLAQLILIRKIYSTGDNDWVELFNPTDYDIDLAASGHRLEKTVTAQDPGLLMRLGDASDGTYPGGTIIKAHDSYLIVRDEAGSYYLNQADAIATRTDFSWGGSGYSLYLGIDAISSTTDPDIIDLVGFGSDASYYLGDGPAPAITDAYILNRLHNTYNNSTDFTLIASDDPNAIETEAAVNPDLFIFPTPLVSVGLTDIWHFSECYGAGSWAVGKWDCARKLGYYHEPLNIPLSPAVDMNDGFSLSFYYKKSENTPSIRTVISNSAGDKFSIRTDASMLEIEGLPNSDFRYYEGIPNDYNWHKLTLVVNQAQDNWEVYIDGTRVIHENFLKNLPIMTNLEIRSDSVAVLLDELALWNRPLAAAEIKADYEADTPYSPVLARQAQTAAELLHFWSFEEDSGTTALDSVGGTVLNLAGNPWVGRSHNNYAIKVTAPDGAHTGILENFPETKDLSLAFWWRDSSDPYNGQADVYLTGGDNNEKNLFAVMADNFRLDYWFNGGYGILAEGLNKTIPGGSDWHYLTLVYDSYRYKLSFYVDGEEKASSSLIYMPDGEKITGIKIQTGGKEAEIDSLSLWQGALSPRQVKEIYANNK
jgi:hypothetical protein